MQFPYKWSEKCLLTKKYAIPWEADDHLKDKIWLSTDNDLIPFSIPNRL